MNAELELITLQVSPREARMVATALACRGLTNFGLSDENWATAYDYSQLAAKIDKQRQL